MGKNLPKYSEFINENFIRKTVSFIKGDKNKIRSLVDQMIDVEKEYIDKTSELSYGLYMTQREYTDRKYKGSSYEAMIRQKNLVARRAMDSFEKARNSQIRSLKDQIDRIVDNDKDLINYYNKEAARGDKAISDYFYKISKEQNQEGYNYQKQLADLEDLRISVVGKDTPSDTSTGTSQESEQEFDGFGSYKIPEPYSLKWNNFISYINNRTYIELVEIRGVSNVVRIRVSSEVNQAVNDINHRKKFLNDEKKKYPANAPLYDVEIDELERNKMQLLTKQEEFKASLRMKIDYINALIKKQRD